MYFYLVYLFFKNHNNTIYFLHLHVQVAWENETSG